MIWQKIVSESENISLAELKDWIRLTDNHFSLSYFNNSTAWL